MRNHFLLCFNVFIVAVFGIQYGYFRYLDMTTITWRQTSTVYVPLPMAKRPSPPKSSITWRKCKGGMEKKHLAFPKNHKVAGSTVMTILSRFAYTRKLNIIIPRPFVWSRMYPYNLYPEYYMPPPPNQTFDMLMYHTVYNRIRFRQILPKDTVYVTIIRNPLSHLKSAWTFYNYTKMFNMSGATNDSIKEFLTDPGRYDRGCKYGEHLPVCLSKNSISVDLGFPASYNNRVTLESDPVERDRITQRFVRRIDNDFDLVMLTEYFDESLVLLKRLMCWTLKDILYIRSVNVKKTKRKGFQLSSALQYIHKQWSYLDYALYDHFNKSFWRRIHSTGNHFEGEVRYFRHLNKKILRHCETPCLVNRAPLVVNDTRWGPGFIVDNDLCLLLRRDVYCHMTLQAERVAKSLSLTAQNASVYSNYSEKYDQKTPTSKQQVVMKVLTPHCVYCKLFRCDDLSYLDHFYRDGYVNKEDYEMTRQKLCLNETKPVKINTTQPSSRHSLNELQDTVLYSNVSSQSKKESNSKSVQIKVKGIVVNGKT